MDLPHGSPLPPVIVFVETGEGVCLVDTWTLDEDGYAYVSDDPARGDYDLTAEEMRLEIIDTPPHVRVLVPFPT